MASETEKLHPMPSRLNSTELSIECDNEMSLDSLNFVDSLSPIPGSMVPRKLDFSDVCGEEPRRNYPPISPPYKRVRALRLFDTPATPLTILEKCSTPTHHGMRARLFNPRQNQLSVQASANSQRTDDSALGSPLPLDDSQLHPDTRANINPFTPTGQLLNKKKRALSKTPTSWDTTPEQPAKRLKESNISRYKEEFLELGVIGRGEFGCVYRCLNRLDGCVYALKRSLRPVAGSAGERSALNEVYAHAVLGKHPHVVRYYSAWAEDDHMIIQNEYCDGGSLQDAIAKRPLPESELLVVLKHVASGLKYIHSRQLVHMDMKPGNIFICAEGVAGRGCESADDGFSEHSDSDDEATSNIYKIGDMGHVTCLSAPAVEEGDCRYLPREVLHEHLGDLTKADIFGLGLTLFEAGGGGPLPKNGDDWHAYRDNKLPDLPNCSPEFNQLLKSMVDPEPGRRPSAARLLRHPLVRCGDSSAELRRELDATRHNNRLLSRKLQEAARCIKSMFPGAGAGEPGRTRSGKARARPPPRLPPDARIIDDIMQTISATRSLDRNRNKC